MSGWFGRRKAILLALPVVFTGWLMTALAINKIMLFVGRGLMSSAILSTAPSIGVYISETVHPSIRSSLMALPAFIIAFGQLLVWTLGYFLPWRMTAYVLISQLNNILAAI